MTSAAHLDTSLFLPAGRWKLSFRYTLQLRGFSPGGDSL